MTTAIQTDFPYDIIYRSDPYELAKQAGFNDENIWSVVEGDEDNVFTYGPPHHFVNVIYWVVTEEAHDHNTYFEESE